MSEKYINNKSPLRWMCDQGHTWRASYNKIASADQWCPECSIDRTRKTCLEKYGVSSPMKNHHIALKSAKAIRKGTLSHWKTQERLFFSSSWEAKVIDYLNAARVNYSWQPTTFILSSRESYRPDLYLVDQDLWVEIKGYWRGTSKKKWEEFHYIIHTNSELWDKEKLISMGIYVR